MCDLPKTLGQTALIPTLLLGEKGWDEGRLVAHRVSSFDFIRISRWCSPIDGKSIVGHGSLKLFGKEVEFGSPLLELQGV